MSKDAKEDKDEGPKWTYGGEEIEWDSFDRRILRYLGKKFDLFGENLWLGNIPDLALMSQQDFEIYCLKVWNTLNIHSPTSAWGLWAANSGFWEKEWQRN